MVQKGDVSAVDIHRDVYPVEVSSRRRKERVFPRFTVGEYSNFEQDFISKIDEIDSRLQAYTEKEDLFHGFHHKHSGLIAKFKYTFPIFDGFWKPEDLKSWIVAIDDFFEEISPPEHVKCNIVWSKMEGAAYFWWKSLQDDRFMEGKEEISSWAKMKKLMISRFVPARCSTKVPNQLNKPEKSREVKHSMVDDFSHDKCFIKGSIDSYSNKHGPIQAAEHKLKVDETVEEINYILEPENCEESSNDDDLEDSFVEEQSDKIVELKSVACSTKISLESEIDSNEEEEYKADCLVSNALTFNSASSHVLLPIYGPDPQVDVSVTTCRLAGSKPLKLSDHIWNELSYMVGSDDWKTYGHCVADRSIHHNLLQIVLKPCNMMMLYEPLIRNFDPGGNIDTARIQVSDLQFRILVGLLSCKMAQDMQRKSDDESVKPKLKCIVTSENYRQLPNDVSVLEHLPTRFGKLKYVANTQTFELRFFCFKRAMERMALNMVYENIIWPCIATPNCRVVPMYVNAYLTPFMKVYICGVPRLTAMGNFGAYLAFNLLMLGNALFLLNPGGNRSLMCPFCTMSFMLYEIIKVVAYRCCGVDPELTEIGAPQLRFISLYALQPLCLGPIVNVLLSFDPGGTVYQLVDELSYGRVGMMQTTPIIKGRSSWPSKLRLRSVHVWFA